MGNYVQSTTSRLNVWSVVCCTWYLEHLVLCHWPIPHFSKAAEVSLTLPFIWFKLQFCVILLNGSCRDLHQKLLGLTSPGDLPQVSRAGRLLWAVCPNMVQVCIVQLTFCLILPSVLLGLVWMFRQESVVYLRVGVWLQQGHFPEPDVPWWTMNAVLSSCTWCLYFNFD